MQLTSRARALAADVCPWRGRGRGAGARRQHVPASFWRPPACSSSRHRPCRSNCTTAAAPMARGCPSSWVALSTDAACGGGRGDAGGDARWHYILVLQCSAMQLPVLPSGRRQLSEQPQIRLAQVFSPRLRLGPPGTQARHPGGLQRQHGDLARRRRRQPEPVLRQRGGRELGWTEFGGRKGGSEGSNSRLAESERGVWF